MREPTLELSPSPGDDVKHTTCYMCACRCGIKVWLRDGKIRYIQGNRDHPVNRGVLCAKGSAGIMQHYSPARLSKPLLRVGERGSGEFREIEWDQALQLATDWLKPIRERNPDELAFFTGRDQSQALTGWWAQQFGTVNYAAHGGFCSVNMAAGGLYTLGGSFWEFGEPDWEHSRYLMLWGVAEDHDSNPIKLGLGKLKARGAKIVAINPVRTGYGAIADEWVGIRPGTDGLLAFALIHELLRNDRVDLDYLVRFTNAHWLVIRDPGAADDGLFARDAERRVLCWHVQRDASRASSAAGAARAATACTEPSPSTVIPAKAGIQPYPHDDERLDRGLRRDDEQLRGHEWLRDDERGADDATEARATGLASADAIGISPAIVGEYTLPDGRTAVPVFHLLAERYLDPQYAPDAVADQCGIPADTIRRLARELAEAAFDHAFELAIPWTDAHGREHATMPGRPVSFHAMRGISAHSNGFHTCRALHLLQLLLGAVDTPGSFRFQPPFPKPIPPANRPGKSRKDNGALDAAPLGFIHSPADLVVDDNGQPRRIDHAYSWAYPLAAHGMMHSVIRNAWAGDPYRIDTLLMFMANMSWNSSMNTTQTMRMLTDKDADGMYRIPRIIYSDAYASEMVAYADLVLPDTTYLERHDGISLLDRPISDADGASDAIRQPVFAPDRDVRPFQSVLLDLGARLGLPGMVDGDGNPAYRDFADYLVRHERAPGVGLLAGWRGADGSLQGKGPPNPAQLDRYVEHGGFWHHAVPENARYYKMANRDYLQWAQGMGFIGHAEPIVLQLYSETLQTFRLAALGHGDVQPPAEHRARVAKYFDPLPIWYASVDVGAIGADASDHVDAEAPLPPGEGLGRGFGTHATSESSAIDASVLLARSPLRPAVPAVAATLRGTAPAGPSSGAVAPPSPGGRRAAGVEASSDAFPLYAITQRPMFMYHAWGSQNAWLRQIATRNYLYLHPDTAARHAVADEDWVELSSPNGTITVQVKLAANVQPDTVWTWNAIGKRKGAWRLAKDAPEATQGFLLNHLISERTRADDYANADPVTGQAAWFDLRVSLRKVDAQPASAPQFAPLALGTASDEPLRYGARLRRKDHA